MAESLITKIILKGETDPTLTKAFTNAQRAVEKNMQIVSKYGDKFKQAAKLATTAIAAGATASLKAAIDYEDAFTGVKKTIDETDTTTYAELSEGIRQMAKEMPSAATEIADVAANAGQLGIKADDVLKFSKVMVQLGETTNLSSGEAADSIARLFNVTGTSMDVVDRFGATLVDLGNNAASTEADIMNMASRIASSGNQIGLTEPQLLALATSLSSVGLEAEAGGTAISTIMSEIDRDVALNTDTLQTWADTAGMSVEQFSTLWETDAYNAIQKIVSGMADAKAGGENLNVLLSELGINNVRTSDTMKRLSSASELMSEMTVLANNAWEENSALTTEAETRYGTMASKLSVLRNNLTDVGITVGNHLMPYLDMLIEKIQQIDFDAVAQKITGAIDWVIEHFDQLKTAAKVIGTVFMAIKIGKFISDIVQLVKSIKTLITVFTGLSKVQSLITAFTNLGGITGILTKGFGLLKGALLAIPGGWIIAIIIAVVGAFVALWNKCEGFRNFWINLWDGIKEFCGNAIDAIINFFTVTIPNGISAVIQWFQQLPSRVGTALSNMISAVGQFLSQLPYKIGYFLGYALATVIQWGINLFNKAVEIGTNFVTGLINWFMQLPSRIWTWLTMAWTNVTTWATNMWNKAIEIGSNFINGIIQFISQLPSNVWNWLTNTITNVASFVTDFGQKALEAGQEFFDNIVNKVQEIPGKMIEIGGNIVSGIWEGISGAAGWLMDQIGGFFSGIVDGAKSALGISSPSKVFANFVGKFIPSGIGKGILNNAKAAIKPVTELSKTVVNKASGIMSNISPKITPVMGKVKNIAGGAFEKARNAIKRIPQYATGGTVTRPQTAIVGDAPETIVPHGNTPRNRALLNEAAKGVGANIGGSTQVNITFAPVINGNGNAEENRKMLQEEEEEFERKMDAYFAKKGRLSYES